MSRTFAHLARLLGLPGDPAVPKGAGDLWYRTDRRQIHAWDGAPSGDPLTVGPVSNAPVIRSGAWHGFPAYGAATSATVPDGRLFALPFWPGRSCTVTAVAANVTVALVGGNIRFGLYANADGVPGTLVADWGTVATGLTGIRSVTGLSAAVRPVLHWLVIARQGGLLNLGLTARDTWEPLVSETTPTLVANNSGYYRDGVTGALPASYGAISGAIQAPSVSVQLT